MSDVIFRTSRPEDTSTLQQLWSQVYQGDEPSLEAYFSMVYHPGDGVVADCGGQIRSFIYLMDGFRLCFPGSPELSCTYLYALGTPDRWRGRGYGGRTIWESGVEGYHRGADAVCFLPASESLFRWYARILGTRTAFTLRHFSAAAAPLSGLTITPVTSEEYNRRREELLAGAPHTRFPLRYIAFQGALCSAYGGGLFSLEYQGEYALAAADIGADGACVRELLSPRPWAPAGAAALAAQLSQPIAHVRTPAFWHRDLGHIEEHTVLVPGGRAFPTAEEAYWGLAFD